MQTTPTEKPLLARAERARLRGAALCARAADAQAAHRDRMASCLVLWTEVCDGGRTSRRFERQMVKLGGLVGRDGAIETAKGILSEQHGITRGQAYELLRHVSQHRNRKLRDVAAQVAAHGGIDPPAR
jgi:hypothetical protein